MSVYESRSSCNTRVHLRGFKGGPEYTTEEKRLQEFAQCRMYFNFCLLFDPFL